MRYTTVAVLLSFFIISCEHDPEEIVPEADENSEVLCDTNKVYFKNDILPILVSSCAISFCHDAASGAAGVIMSSYDQLINSNIITAGDPDDSDLYERIIETDINKRMPLGGNRLAQENIDKIRQWILDGAENTSCQSGAK